ncbi:MAG: 30S ribosomal protein S6 [Candidatus Methylomirabilales bacterium]
MSEYEVIVILEAGLADEALEAQVELLKGFLAREGAEVLEVQKWGKRRLAYEIKKKREGFYVLFRVKGKPTLAQALDRHLKFAEVVLRYLAVRVEPVPRSQSEKATTGAAATKAGGEEA